jgi:serine/threonine protein kinase
MSNIIGHYHYNRDRIINSGATSNVYIGTDLFTMELISVKVINKSKIKNEYILNEIEILKTLSNVTHIVQLKDNYETESEYILVFEYCELNLKQYIPLLKNMNEIGKLDKVKSFTLQFISILAILNKYKVIHHDIKPENILIKDDKLLLCDFGMAVYKNNVHRVLCGTPMYMHPTKLDANYNYNSDEWSFGIIFYELLYNCHPFIGAKNKKELIAKIKENKIIFPEINCFTPYLINILNLKIGLSQLQIDLQNIIIKKIPDDNDVMFDDFVLI